MIIETTKEWTDVLNDIKWDFKHTSILTKIFDRKVSAINDILEYAKTHKDDECIHLCKNKALGSFTDSGNEAWEYIETLITLFPRLSWIQKVWIMELEYARRKSDTWVK